MTRSTRNPRMVTDFYHNFGLPEVKLYLGFLLLTSTFFLCVQMPSRFINTLYSFILIFSVLESLLLKRVIIWVSVIYVYQIHQ